MKVRYAVDLQDAAGEFGRFAYSPNLLDLPSLPKRGDDLLLNRAKRWTAKCIAVSGGFESEPEIALVWTRLGVDSPFSAEDLDEAGYEASFFEKVLTGGDAASPAEIVQLADRIERARVRATLVRAGGMSAAALIVAVDGAPDARRIITDGWDLIRALTGV